MRIALTITDLDPGGAEQCLVHLACFLANRGHEIEVLALGSTPRRSLGTTPQRDALIEPLDRLSIPWKCGPARRSTSLLATTRWLRVELNRLQPQIIQSMLFHANFVTALANFGHDVLHIGGARVAQTQRLRQLAQRWAVRKMSKLVCVSQSVADHCQQTEGIPSHKLMVIPNGIADQREHEPDAVPPALQACLPTLQTPFFLFVGRLSEQKGIMALLQQVDSLLDPLPNHHFVLLGDGPLKENLQSLIQAAQNGSRVHLLGWQPAAQSWMRHAEMLLLPSNFEGMPNVVLEAMQAGIPVVSFDVEGMTELLGQRSIQVVSGSIEQFIERVHHLANDAKLASEVVRENRQRLADNFRLEDQLAKYEKLYEKLLSTSTKLAEK